MEFALKITNKTLLPALGAAVLWLTHTTASAQQGPFWVITYIGQQTVQSVPTLSEWGMISMSVILAVFAAYFLRKKGVGKPLASIVLLGGLALGGMFGNSVISNAHAAFEAQMTLLGGGIVSIEFSGDGDEIPVHNVTSAPQTITAMNRQSGTPTQGGTTCAVGVTVPAGGFCYVKLILE